MKSEMFEEHGLKIMAVAAAVGLVGVLVLGCATTPRGTDVAARWVVDRPVQVYADPDLPTRHRAALEAAVEAIDAACQCRILLRPVTGAPILRQEIPGAPDRGTVYVRGDGNTHPETARTTPYYYPDGRIFSVEVELPLRGVTRNSYFFREFTDSELRGIAVHEVGHSVMGLSHSTDPLSAFFPERFPGQTITPADAAMLRKVYGGVQ